MEIDYRYSCWKDEYNYLLKDLSNKKIIVLYSGGKDSSLTLDYIVRAGEEFGFTFDVHTSAFPIHRYTAEEKEKIQTYWDNRGVDIIWHEPQQSDEILETADNPCKKCQLTNKKLLNDILTRMGEDWDRLFVIAGYSLWDIVSYTIEHILNNIYAPHGQSLTEENKKRLIETGQRFYPVLRMKEGYSVFRPLIKVGTTDIMKEIRRIGIPILSTSCKFQEYRPKRHLMRYYEKMDMTFDYEQVLEFAKSLPHFPDISPYTLMKREEYFSKVF